MTIGRWNEQSLIGMLEMRKEKSVMSEDSAMTMGR